MRNIAIHIGLVVALGICGCASSQTQSALPNVEDQSSSSLAPISKDKFEKWAPNKLSDLSLTLKEHGNPPSGQENKNNIHLIYANETQEKKMELYVVDCAENPRDMEMIDFSYAMENDGKDEKDIKAYITQYDDQKKVTMLLYKVSDRLFVNATGANIEAEELWGYVQNLNVENLLNN